MVWRPVQPTSERPMVGRHAEREEIGRLLEAVREGLSGVLVLTGEPGVGKTRLLEYAAEAAVAAGDVSVVRLVGVESETRLAYGALHRLLRPFLTRLSVLPQRQRDALNGAFGVAEAVPSDRYLVGLAALTLLADVASERPMLCLVDDVHWLDRESAETLAFVARRLHADALGLVFAARDGAAQLVLLEALTTVPVEGLPAEEAGTLLASAVDGFLNQAVTDQIVAGTGGNPLALLELAGHLGAEQLAGVAPLPEPLPVNSMLEWHFQRSVMALPDDTRSLLLLVATTPADDRATLWRAAGALGLSFRAALPAVAAGVLDHARTVEFRHPLIRSAVYSAASSAERRRVHAVLASTSAPDRRAWHRAEATDGTDDEVAAHLEAASERPRSRGGYSEQAVFLSRAAELTTDPARRAERFLNAAAASLTSGDATATQALLDLATPDLTGSARARATRIRASVEMLHIRVATVPALLLDAVAELGDAEPAMSWELLHEATHAALVGGSLLVGTTLKQVAEATVGARRDPAPPSWSPDPLMLGLARLIAVGHPVGVPAIRDALRRLCDSAELRELNSPFSVMVTMAADELWDIEAKREIVGRLAAVDRSAGALYGLTLALIVLATTEMSEGRFAAAEAYYAEADDYSTATGYAGGGEMNRILLYAWTGQEHKLRAATGVMRDLAKSCGLGSQNRLAAHALAVFDIGRSRHREALGHLLPPFVEDTLPYCNFLLPLVVEAGVRAGDRAVAAVALERMEERATLAGTPWALGSLARCRALMAEGDDAEESYQESIDLLGKAPVAVELAWSRLLFGEWLRRRRRRSEARVQLRAAYESFETWGAAPFAERARAELLATGEKARKRTVETRLDLTPQEQRVASLAASGLTNTEIASRLFVTTSTVEFHLNKVFRKLDISSRRQIASVLGETGLESTA